MASGLIASLFNRFSEGEISADCDGLVGTEFYQGASKEITNWITRKELCLEKRLGLQFRFLSYNDANSVDLDFRLYRFAARDQTWFLEFSAAASGRSKVRAYTIDGQLLKSDGTYTRDWTSTAYTFQMPASAATYGNPDYTISDDELFELDIKRDGDTVYLTHKNHCPVQIIYTEGDSVPFSCEYMTFTGNGYLQDDLDALKNNQIGPTPDKSRMTLSDGYFGDDADSINPATFRGVSDLNTPAVMILDSHPDGDEYRYVCRAEWIDFHALCRTSSSISAQSNIDCAIQFTDRTGDDKMKGVVVDDSGSGSITGYASFSPPVLGSKTEMALVDTLSTFNSNDVGLAYMADFGQFEIIQVNSSTAARGECVAQVKQSNMAVANDGSGSVTYDDVIRPTSFRCHARPAWGNNLTGTYSGAVETGWPGVCAVHDGRLVLMDSKAEPVSIWGSEAGEPENFALGPDDTQAFQYRIRASEMDEIVASCSGPVLFMLTKTGVYRSVSREPLSPSSVSAFKSYSFGSERITPVSVGPWYAFVAQGGRKIIAMRYNDNYDQIEGYDLTRYASHILGTDPVVQLEAQQDDLSAVLAVCGDGRLAYGMFLGEEPKPAWSHIETYDDDGTLEQIFTVAVGKRDGEDQIWCGVRRTVDGSTRRFIEVMDTQNYSASSGQVESSSAQVYLDSSLDLLTLISGSGTLVGNAAGIAITGLTTLAGRTCQAIINGAKYTGIDVETDGTAGISLNWWGTTLAITGTTVTFNGNDADADFVDSYFVTSGGGLYRLTGYTSTSSMTCAVISGGNESDVDFAFVNDFAIGLPYECVWTPHIPEMQLRDGTSQCRVKKLQDAWLRVRNAYDLVLRVDVDGGDPIDTPVEMRLANEDAGAAPTMKDGDFSGTIDGPNDRLGLFSVVSNGPFPAKLLLCKVRMEVYDD